MKRFLHIAVLALLAVSCEIPFELDQAGSPLIFVQAVAQDGSMVITPRYAAPVNGGSGKVLPDGLEVRLQVNGKPAAVQSMENGQYRCEGPFQEGDLFALELSAEGLTSASGSTSLPGKPVITDFSWQNIQVDTIRAVEVRMSLDHAPGEGEYYGIQISCQMNITYADTSTDSFTMAGTPGYVLSAADAGSMDLEDFMQVNFQDGVLGGKDYAPITLVTKKQFDGTLYKFYLDSYDATMLDALRSAMPGADDTGGAVGGGIISGDINEGGGQGGLDPSKIPVAIQTIYTFTLSRLSTEFFLYTKALYQSNFDFLSNMGLTPANFTYTNISGGLGMVGALSSATVGPVEIEKDWSNLLQK